MSYLHLVERICQPSWLRIRANTLPSVCIFLSRKRYFINFGSTFALWSVGISSLNEADDNMCHEARSGRAHAPVKECVERGRGEVGERQPRVDAEYATSGQPSCRSPLLHLQDVSVPRYKSQHELFTLDFVSKAGVRAERSLVKVYSSLIPVPQTIKGAHGAV